MKECFRLSEENMKWFEKNYESLKQQYNGKWVAIHENRVIEVAKDLESLVETIKDHKHRECILVEHIRAEPIAMFF